MVNYVANNSSSDALSGFPLRGKVALKHAKALKIEVIKHFETKVIYVNGS